MPEPIIQSRVVDFHELHEGDIIRATLTDHEIYGRPLEHITSQVEGLVRHTTNVGDNWSAVLELEGEVLTRTIKEHWTVELLHKTGRPRR